MEVADKDLWAIYVWWVCIFVLKMKTLMWFTGQLRVSRQVIHSEEDRRWMKKPNEPTTICPSAGGHPDVDRIRAAHFRDLETAMPYVVITALWLSTAPCPGLARVLLHLFGVLNVTCTLAKMQMLELHRHCLTATYLAQISILTYMSVMSLLYYGSMS